MPLFSDYPSSPLIKALYLGDSGAGKTGSLSSLAASGYQVRVLDLDAMALVIKDFVTNPASQYCKAAPGKWSADLAKDVAKRISYVTITETITQIQNRPVPKGDAWQRITAQLQQWRDGGEDLGNVGTWDYRTVLVIDGLTKLSKAAWNWQLAMNGRLLGRPEQNDYWQAQKLIEELLLMLAGPGTPCHVIIVCHVDYIENDAKLERGYPATVGRALSPTLARNFLHVLMAKSTGQGTGIKRQILTSTTGTIDLKTPVPLRAKPQYDLETGLADYFADVLGHYGPVPIEQKK